MVFKAMGQDVTLQDRMLTGRREPLNYGANRLGEEEEPAKETWGNHAKCCSWEAK